MQGRREDQQRPGGEQRNVGAPLSLERAERAGHRPLRRVVDEHDREQELVPGPDREEDPERRERGPGQRNVDRARTAAR